MLNTPEVVEEGTAAHQAGRAHTAADAAGKARAEDAVAAGKLLVIIPAYNEAGRVGGVIADVRRELPHADVLVVDDGSEDATAREAAAAGAIVVRLPVNCGYGTALQTGYKYAARHDYAFVGQIDADGQHRAEYLAEMLETVSRGQADVVVGSRFLARDGHYDTPLARAIGIGLFGRLATFATGQTVTDPTSGFQVMRAEIAHLFARDVFPVDYPDADVLILLHRTGYRVRELAVQMRPSPGSSMHTRNSTPYYVYKMLLSILVTLLRPRGRHPR
jgi:glycosyltransferase involved in cell wall biosynthesis